MLTVVQESRNITATQQGQPVVSQAIIGTQEQNQQQQQAMPPADETDGNSSVHNVNGTYNYM